MAEPRRLTLADQALINVLAAIQLPVIIEPAREDMLIAVLREVLPGSSSEHPQMMPLIEAAKGFLDGPVSDAPRTVSARLRAAGPLADFFMGRAGQALEAMRAAKNGGENV
jgi:hypothetical protein